MSTIRKPGSIKQLWFRWKALRLPWRRQWLVGNDLAGNTFWEFKDHLNANRLRRVMRHARTAHYADVKLSPQWHQWLRHTRDDPPTIEEQQYDVSRQEMMKQLAAQADERWNSKPSFLDAPQRQRLEPADGVSDQGQHAPQPEAGKTEGVMSAVEGQVEVDTAATDASQDARRSKGKVRDKGPNPWQRSDRGAPSENWQPESWTPGVAQRR